MITNIINCLYGTNFKEIFNFLTLFYLLVRTKKDIQSKMRLSLVCTFFSFTSFHFISYRFQCSLSSSNRVQYELKGNSRLHKSAAVESGSLIKSFFSSNKSFEKVKTNWWHTENWIFLWFIMIQCYALRTTFFQCRQKRHVTFWTFVLLVCICVCVCVCAHAR